MSQIIQKEFDNLKLYLDLLINECSKNMNSNAKKDTQTQSVEELKKNLISQINCACNIIKIHISNNPISYPKASRKMAFGSEERRKKQYYKNTEESEQSQQEEEDSDDSESEDGEVSDYKYKKQKLN